MLTQLLYHDTNNDFVHKLNDISPAESTLLRKQNLVHPYYSRQQSPYSKNSMVKNLESVLKLLITKKKERPVINAPLESLDSNMKWEDPITPKNN